MTLPEWHIAQRAELSDPGAIEFSVGDGDWPFRGVLVCWQGSVYAYANSCAHLGHPLNLAADQFFTPDNSLLVCASHGAVFEPATGVCVGGPCAGASLRSLECRVDEGSVFVRAPASARDSG